MFVVFLGFIANQFAASALFFLIVWVVMRKRNGVKVVGAKWLIPGIVATAFVGGLARFVFWMVSGESASASLTLSGDAGLLFFLGLPISIAIGLCAFLGRQKS